MATRIRNNLLDLLDIIDSHCKIIIEVCDDCNLQELEGSFTGLYGYIKRLEGKSKTFAKFGLIDNYFQSAERLFLAQKKVAHKIKDMQT